MSGHGSRSVRTVDPVGVPAATCLAGDLRLAAVGEHRAGHRPVPYRAGHGNRRSGVFEIRARGRRKSGEDRRGTAPLRDRDIAQIDPIERGVLRLAAYELLFRIDVPYRVVLNEAIETTKRFGADHGHSYVNGVLDRAAAQWREPEVSAARR